MRYSEEQRRNSKINREELDLYIKRNYVALPGEDGSEKQRPEKRSGLFGKLSGMHIAGAGKNSICESVPLEDLHEAISEEAAESFMSRPSEALRKEATKPSAPLPMESSASIYAERRKTEPAKKYAGSAKIKKEVISEDLPEDLTDEQAFNVCQEFEESSYSDYDDEDLYRKLAERVSHVEDSFSDYLMFLIRSKGLSNADVYKRALVDKKVFSKIKNNPDYHPQKLTAMCLCIGAMLNLDESRDLLARAGYALSPSDKTDIIFSYFIENEIYDMIELDIQLEEHGLECIIA